MIRIYHVGKHFLYWIASAIFLILFIGHKKDSSFTIPFVLTLLPVAIGLPYIFTHYLVPKYLLKRAYFPFGIYGLTAIVASLYLEMLIILLAFIFFANFTYEVMYPIAGNLALVATAVFLIQGVFIIAHLVKQNLQPKQVNTKSTVLQVRSDRRIMNLELTDIFFIESLSDYVKIHLSNEFIITKEKISSLEKRLPNLFLRTHRSYLINTQKIDSFTKTSIETKGETLPISRTYKKDVLDTLSKND